MTRSEGLMAFDIFKSVVDQIAADSPQFSSKHTIWLHGFGESLVHPEFERFIAYGASRGLKLGLSVNPLLLSGAIADALLRTSLDTLVASLDGHDDESFARIRGVNNAFERSKDNLIKFLDRKVSSKWKTKVVVSMINFGQNGNSIRALENYWSVLPGVDEFVPKRFVTFNGDAQEIRALDNGLHRMRKAPFVVCSRPWDMMTITWDGEVVPCCYDYDKKYVIGNLNQQSLREIWRGEKLQALRREFLSNQVTNPLCRSCPSLRGDIISEGW